MKPWVGWPRLRIVESASSGVVYETAASIRLLAPAAKPIGCDPRKTPTANGAGSAGDRPDVERAGLQGQRLETGCAVGAEQRTLRVEHVVVAQASRGLRGIETVRANRTCRCRSTGSSASCRTRIHRDRPRVLDCRLRRACGCGGRLWRGSRARRRAVGPNKTPHVKKRTMAKACRTLAAHRLAPWKAGMVELTIRQIAPRGQTG